MIAIPENLRFNWIPPSQRTKLQRLITGEFHEMIGTFSSRGQQLVTLPERVLMHELEIKTTGALLPRIHQLTGSCLPSDSLVSVYGRAPVRISEICPGDWVRTHTENFRQVLGVSVKYTKEAMRHILTDEGRRLRCTDKHRIAVANNSGEIEWREAQTVIPGMKLFITDNGIFQREVVVKSNVALGVPHDPVWDIEVEYDHSFIADGFVVHNCVGAGGARAYTLAQVGDVFVRGDAEEIKIPFPYATYGVGREIAGSRGTGEGSFGGAQAKAIKQFGMLPWDDERVPKPEIKNGWASWRSNQEIQWSHPKAWPIKRSELEPDAQKFQITDVTQAESTDDVDQGLAQGFGVTIACMFGTKPRVEDDVLLGRWNDSWAHQQSITGYWLHPKHGKIYVVDNQWDDVHGHCPTLFPLGVTGSYWMLEKDLAKIIKSQDGEVYLHSNTEGFPLQQIDWGTMGICG